MKNKSTCVRNALKYAQEIYASSRYDRGVFSFIGFLGREVICTGTQLLIVIIDATWNVNAC